MKSELILSGSRAFILHLDDEGECLLIAKRSHAEKLALMSGAGQSFGREAGRYFDAISDWLDGQWLNPIESLGNFDAPGSGEPALKIYLDGSPMSLSELAELIKAMPANFEGIAGSHLIPAE